MFTSLLVPSNPGRQGTHIYIVTMQIGIVWVCVQGLLVCVGV